MKRLLTYLMIFALLLSLAACNGKAPETSTGETVDAQKQPTVPTDSLSTLRAEMKPPVMAVADFYYPTMDSKASIMEFLQDEYPLWIAKMDFITQIPEERIVLTCGWEDWGNLVCVVPCDPAATVTVTLLRYQDEEPYELEETVYRSESGDPILLLASTDEDEQVFVTVVDSEGRGAKWYPDWFGSVPIPDDAYSGNLVMDFTPETEQTDYDYYVEAGWFAPDISVLADGWWETASGYGFELYYNPSELSDGTAYLSSINELGEYELEYMGNWLWADGRLSLDLQHVDDSSLTVQGDFPVLTDPWGAGWLGIGRCDDGTGLPYFSEYQGFDELWRVSYSEEDFYSYCISQGWRIPELWELADTFWLSDSDYALELMDDSVSGDNGGSARLYDVGDYGEYTVSYTGSWAYEDGMLYLSLVPKFGDGVLVDDSFPVLMLDGQLWIGLNESGIGLPYFYSDTLADILTQPAG